MKYSFLSFFNFVYFNIQPYPWRFFFSYFDKDNVGRGLNFTDSYQIIINFIVQLLASDYLLCFSFKKKLKLEIKENIIKVIIKIDVEMKKKTKRKWKITLQQISIASSNISKDMCAR